MAPWFSREDFLDVVRQIWEGHSDNILQTITTFTQRAKWWKEIVLGHVPRKKRTYLGTLSGIQNAFANR